jgi:hypothetical protein
MGQQQLLLIVLGVIIVGVAVVLGIQYFGVGAEESAKDELVSHSLTIGANAQQWFKKPTTMGGGGLSFVGFDSQFNNNLVKLHSSTSGTYTVGSISATGLTVTGLPKAALGYDWTVTCNVYADSMSTSVQ